tara:strand:+ start:7490 stop:7675 length:186 start_codon:yes stop_codon:yes gene_type:complete
MPEFIASFKCPDCKQEWETNYTRKIKEGYKDYCRYKPCLNRRLREGGVARPLVDNYKFRVD